MYQNFLGWQPRRIIGPMADAEDVSKTFGLALKRAREARGWSQRDLAAAMVDAGWKKYNQVSVARTEGNTRKVRLDEAVALAGVVGLGLDELLGKEQSARHLTHELDKDATEIVNIHRFLSTSFYDYLARLNPIFERLAEAKAISGSSTLVSLAASRVTSSMSTYSPQSAIESAISSWARDNPKFDALVYIKGMTHGLHQSVVINTTVESAKKSKEFLGDD